MDPNNPPPAQPNISTPISTPPQISPAGGEEKTSMRMLYLLVGGVLIILLAVGGIYLFLNNQNKGPKTASEQTSTVPVSTPSPEPVSEEEATSVDVGDVEAEFSTVEKDLQGL